MSRIEAVHFPTDTSPGQMFGAWATLLARFGYEFGEILDHLMTKADGPDWMQLVVAQRTAQDPKGRLYKADLHDITFVLGEPVKQDSLIRKVLPADLAWVPLFNRVRHHRNDWMHRTVDWSLDQLELSVEALDSLVRLVSPQMPVASDVSAMFVRLFDLRASGGAIPDPQVEEMKQLLDGAQQQADAARSKVTQLLSEMEKLAGAAAAGDAALLALRDQLRQAEADAADAREEFERLRREVEARGESRRRSRIQPPPDLKPGDAWTLPRGERRMYLQKQPAVGLFDVDKSAFVGGEFELAAKAAAARWLRVMPLGGDIWVTDTWHAAGMVGLTLTYLGRLDRDYEQVEAVGAPIVSALTAHSYTLTGDGQILAEDGTSLSDVIGVDAAAAVVAGLAEGTIAAREAGEESTSGEVDLRVTYDGVVAAPFGEQDRGYVGRVTAEGWFPGHLRE